MGRDTYIRSKIEILDFYEKTNVDTIAIGYNRDRYHSRVAEDFIDLACEACAKIYHQNGEET